MKIGILSKTANSINKDTTKNILNDTAPYDAVNGTPDADEGYTSTPCGVCLQSILNKKIYSNYLFCTRNFMPTFFSRHTLLPYNYIMLKINCKANIY